jgi:hypothetical protein
VPTLTVLPTTLTAGDSVTLTLTRPDYPASAGWTLTYALAGAAVQQWSSTPSGAAHTITLSSAETAALPAGDYRFALKATAPGQVHTLATGGVAVLADVAALQPGEAVSYWQQLKEAAEAALLSIMAGGGVQMATIMGRQATFRSPQDCLQVIATCEMRLQAAQTRTFGTPVRFDVVMR